MYGTRARPIAALVAALLVVSVASCSKPRTTSIPAADGDPPTTVHFTGDPADSPELAAIPTVVTRPGTTAPETDDDHFSVLAAHTKELLAKFDGDELVSIDCSWSGITWKVIADSTHRFTDTWEWDEPYQEDIPPFTKRADDTPTTDETFTLDGVDLDAPARIEAGAQRRSSAIHADSAELDIDTEWGLHWEIRLSRPGQSIEVIAGPDGDVWAVEG